MSLLSYRKNHIIESLIARMVQPNFELHTLHEFDDVDDLLEKLDEVKNYQHVIIATDDFLTSLKNGISETMDYKIKLIVLPSAIEELKNFKEFRNVELISATTVIKNSENLKILKHIINIDKDADSRNIIQGLTLDANPYKILSFPSVDSRLEKYKSDGELWFKYMRIFVFTVIKKRVETKSRKYTIRYNGKEYNFVSLYVDSFGNETGEYLNTIIGTTQNDGSVYHGYIVHEKVMYNGVEGYIINFKKADSEDKKIKKYLKNLDVKKMAETLFTSYELLKDSSEKLSGVWVNNEEAKKVLHEYR